MEKEYPLAVFIIKYYCDNCKEGEFITAGNLNINMAQPPGPKYRNVCNNCGISEFLDKPYPCLLYEIVEGKH